MAPYETCRKILPPETFHPSHGYIYHNNDTTTAGVVLDLGIDSYTVDCCFLFLFFLFFSYFGHSETIVFNININETIFNFVMCSMYCIVTIVGFFFLCLCVFFFYEKSQLCWLYFICCNFHRYNTQFWVLIVFYVCLFKKW